MPHGLLPEAFVKQTDYILWSEAVASKCHHDTCAICHEAFSATPPDICRVLDCAHVFHAKCVDLWFIKATFCPMCKSDLKQTYRNNSSQRSLGQPSQTSSQRSLGSRSQSSLRSGQILVGHSNSDPAILGVLRERPHAPNAVLRGSPPATPDRAYQHPGSSTSLAVSSHSERSLPGMGSSRSERSIGMLSSSSSGALPVVQEASEEARAVAEELPSQTAVSDTEEATGHASRFRNAAGRVPSDPELAAEPILPDVTGAQLPSMTEERRQPTAEPPNGFTPVRITSLPGNSADVRGRPHPRVTVARGHTSYSMPYLMPPISKCELLPQDASDAARSRNAATSTAVIQAVTQTKACTTVGEGNLNDPVRGVCVVPTPSSSAALVASATSVTFSTAPAARSVSPLLPAASGVAVAAVASGAAAVTSLHEVQTSAPAPIAQTAVGYLGPCGIGGGGYGVSRPVVTRMTTHMQQTAAPAISGQCQALPLRICEFSILQHRDQVAGTTTCDCAANNDTGWHS